MSHKRETAISAEESARIFEEFRQVVKDNPMTESDLGNLRQSMIHPFSVLDERERQVIERRYGIKDGNERTQAEVASEMGFSATTARRVEKKAISKLKRASNN